MPDPPPSKPSDSISAANLSVYLEHRGERLGDGLERWRFAEPPAKDK